MSELDHSKRATLQATYTPIQLSPKERVSVATNGRAIEKYNFAASLKPTNEEIDQLTAQYQSNAHAAAKVDALHVVKKTLVEAGARLTFGNAPQFRRISPDTLATIGSDLVELRKKKLTALLADQNRLANAFLSQVNSQTAAVTGPAAKTAADLSKAERRSVLLRSEAAVLGASLQRSVANSVNTPTRGASETNVSAPSRMLDPSEVKLGTLVNWAQDQSSDQKFATTTLTLAGTIVSDPGSLTLGDIEGAVWGYVDFQNRLLEGFRANFAVEPIGYLHLERMTFTPAGIIRGELLHSLALAPGEEVNISHREWSNTSQEFERIVTDSLENYSEQGVTEKSELSQSTSSQQQHSTGLDTSVTASAGYGLINRVNVSASAARHVSDASSESEQETRNQSSTVTRKASTRVKKEYKVSFRVESAAGTEDQAVRRVKNPFKQRATRVDYYELVRKWKIDLYRYGVRLTYDITIPEPGSDIISRIKEIQQIRDDLEQEFGAEENRPIHPLPGWTGKPPWALFDLSPDELEVGTYASIAAQYGASPAELPQLLPETLETEFESHTPNWTDDSQVEKAQLFVLNVDVDENYEIVESTIDNPIVHPHIRGGAPWFWVEGLEGVPQKSDKSTWEQGVFAASAPLPVSDLIGKTGKLFLGYGVRDVWAAEIKVNLTLKLKDEVRQQWQYKVWAAIRDAAMARYSSHLEILKDRLDRLTQAVGSQDSLSLRKVEREEVMKGVLRWLLGSNLQFGSPTSETLYDPTTQTIDPRTWADVLSYGEFIKFLHNAIEWENMVYFLYPYFWSHVQSWELRKYLDHPDPIHKAFLRAGAARVVLTIRPGFEQAFTKLLQLGSFYDALQTEGLDHPYVTIAEEMQNFAETNYPGVEPANTVESSRPLLTPKQKKAWSEMQAIMYLLELYYHDGNRNRYPNTAEGIRALQPYLSQLESPLSSLPTIDPWGNEYVYTSPGLHADYDLLSYGDDVTSEKSNQKEHIESWAEASLIATWYEYTPTSAMDIAFDKTLPDAYEAQYDNR